MSGTSLASGMDTESIVKKLMDAERLKSTRLQKEKQRYGWKEDSYNVVNKQIASFIIESKKEMGIKTDSFGNISSSSVSSLTWIKKGVSSDDSTASVTAGAKSPDGTHSIEVTQLAESAKYSLKLDADGKLQKDFTVNGKNFSAGTVVTDIISSIKNDSTLSKELSVNYDGNNNYLFLSTKTSGSDKSLNITYDGATSTITGKDMEYKYNGLSEVFKSKTNQTEVNGINFEAKKQGTVNISITTDTKSIVDKVKKFVDDYNAMLGGINTLLGEKKYRNYEPLTKEQKADMKETEIKLWEEKAKSGVLRSDPILTDMTARSRRWLYEEVEGIDNKNYNQIAELGITTKGYKDNGKLQIDEEKLTKAIEADPEAVIDMLFKSSGNIKDESQMTVAELDQKRKETGLIGRIFDEFTAGIKEVVEQSGTGNNEEMYRSIKSNILLDFATKFQSVGNLEKEMKKIEQKLDFEDRRLLDKENFYWNKFTAMEKAIQKMTSQSSWLNSQGQ